MGGKQAGLNGGQAAWCRWGASSAEPRAPMVEKRDPDGRTGWSPGAEAEGDRRGSLQRGAREGSCGATPRRRGDARRSALPALAGLAKHAVRAPSSRKACGRVPTFPATRERSGPRRRSGWPDGQDQHTDHWSGGNHYSLKSSDSAESCDQKGKLRLGGIGQHAEARCIATQWAYEANLGRRRQFTQGTPTNPRRSKAPYQPLGGGGSPIEANSDPPKPTQSNHRSNGKQSKIGLPTRMQIQPQSAVMTESNEQYPVSPWASSKPNQDHPIHTAQ
jgi:hypothetical protein